jgi:hypothetical protein
MKFYTRADYIKIILNFPGRRSAKKQNFAVICKLEGSGERYTGMNIG